MSKIKYIDEEIMIRKGIKALIDTLGPVETNRFIRMPKEKRIDSVKRHQEWQNGLDKDEFFKKIFG